MKIVLQLVCGLMVGAAALALGQADDQTATGGGAGDMATHIVKPGEDLYTVSMLWDVSIGELKRVNGLAGTSLVPGQTLRIPVTAPPDIRPAAPAPAIPPPPDRPPSGPHKMITVEPGEDLFSVAMVWDVSVPELQRINQLSGTELVPGQKLYVPLTAPEQAAAGSRDVPDPHAHVHFVPTGENSGAAAKPAIPQPLGRPPSGPYKVITVGSGDDLYSVAMVWEVSVSELQKINQLSGTDLAPGQKLYIPLEDPEQAAVVSRDVPDPHARLHVVSAGEDAQSVARLWAVPVEALQATNRLTGVALTPGQRLIIPDVNR